jgi:hypothetical protein
MKNQGLLLTRLYERTDHHGRPYFVGRIGLTKVEVHPTGTLSKGDRVWAVRISEAVDESDQAAERAAT